MKKIILLLFTCWITSAAIGQIKSPNPFLLKKKNQVAEPNDTPTIDGRSNDESKKGLVNQSISFDNNLKASLKKGYTGDLLKVTKYAQGLPVMIEGSFHSETNSKSARTDVSSISFSYLQKVKGVMKIEKPEEEFSITNLETDELGITHMRMQQMYKGIKVWGSQVILHGKDNQINLLNGRHFPTPQLLDVNPTLTQRQASQLAVDHAKLKSKFNHLSDLLGTPLQNDESMAELIVYHENDQLEREKLCWHITVRPNLLERWEYFIDAKNGNVVEKYLSHCSIDGPRTATATDLNGQSRTVNSYQVGTNYFLIDATRPMYNVLKSTLPDSPTGAIWTIDGGNKYPSNPNFNVKQIASTNNTWSATATSAHYNASVAYEYYRTVHGRNSVDGKGGTVISIINVSDEDGTGLDNAFWSDKYMFYGNGKTAFKPLAGGLDVAGHEITHGVVQNSANLEYKGQSGAINESMADIFGSLMDRNDFLIGEDVVKTSVFTSGALRSLQDPNQGGTSLNFQGYQPKNMTQYYSGTEDNGGVHINSGIVNQAYYLFVTTSGMTKEKAEKIYYRALTQYLTAKSQFIDLRLALIKSAEDIHGVGAAEVTALKAAFDAVGITDGAGNTAPTPGSAPYSLPTNTGTEFILSYNLATTGGGLQVSSITGTNISLKTPTKPRTKPSITDDGTLAVFVAEDQKIHLISLTGSVNEQVVTSTIKWNSVAISKDGRKIAATTSAKDTSIYIISLDKSKTVKYRLYNPTNTQGVNAGGVVYADALDWDHTGEYIAYDAFNQIDNADGGSIEYWDIGFIKVWDNDKNDFGSGEVSKLFSGLAANESVGNPVFSKNSPSVIAFDYYDSDALSVGVVAWNYEIGDGNILFTQDDFSFPSFSKADDKLVFSAVNNSGVPVLAPLSLNTDKISTSTSPSGILSNTKWGVVFAQGNRNISPMNIGVLATTPICGGTNLSIPYSANYVYYQGNKFTAQLSDATGSFATPLNIGSITSTASGAISATIPTTTKAGNGYRVRVVSSNPILFGRDNGVNLTICDLTTGLEYLNDGFVTVYPNPTQDKVYVKFPSIVKEGTIKLNSTLSSELLEFPFENKQEVEINLSDFSKGMYFIQLQIGDKIVTKKIVVQ
jgi:bacillolysin